MTLDDLRAKLEWEGGLGELIDYYGVHLPEDLECEPSLHVAWANLYKYWQEVATILGI